MTVQDEMTKYADYQKLKYVEFLEFIARVAYAKYIEDEAMPLAVKVEQILDSVLPIYGLKRKEAEADIGDDATSDESVFVLDEDIVEAKKHMDYYEELIFKDKWMLLKQLVYKICFLCESWLYKEQLNLNFLLFIIKI